MLAGSSRARLVSLCVLFCAAVGLRASAVAQRGEISGVVLETRTNQQNERAVFVQVQGTGQQTFDGLTLEFPRGVLTDGLTVVPPASGMAWPKGWTCNVTGGRVMTITGPPIDYTTGLFRLDLGSLPPPKTAKIQIHLGGRRLFNRENVIVTELVPLALTSVVPDVLIIPELATPGRGLNLGVVNPERTPFNGTWRLNFQYSPRYPPLNLSITPVDPKNLIAQVPAERSIVDDIVAGALKGGFGVDPVAGRPDHLTDADWAALTNDEKQIQSRLVNEFTMLSQGTAAAVTDYLHFTDAFRTAFQRITSSSTELQGRMAQFEKVVSAAQTTDFALAVTQLGYGGIKGGTALFRWLTRPKTIADLAKIEARAGAVVAGRAADAAVPAAGAARPAGALALAEQITSAQRGAIGRMASEAGIDANAWLARHGGNVENAYVALVNRMALQQGLVSLTTPARHLLVRLVVAAANARAGRAGAATAQEILQLRQWAQQPGFWDKLGKAAQWYEEPGRLVAGGQEMFQPAQQFAMTFSPEEIALLRSLAESDDAARLASQLGVAAQDLPPFIDRVPPLDTPALINPGQPPAIPPTIGRLPQLDTSTWINPGRAPRIPDTYRGGAAPDTPTFIDQFIPPTNLPLGLGRQGGAIQLLPPSLTPGPNGTVRLTESAIQGAAGEWSTLMNLRSAGAWSPAILLPPAGAQGTLQVQYIDRWGDTVLSGEQPFSILPALTGAVKPVIFDVTPRAFPGDQICVCGVFPGATSGSLRLNGAPIVPVTSSEYVTCLQVPGALGAGNHTISGDPAAGFDASNTVTIGILTLGGELDRNKLMRGESTPLRIWINGTTDRLPILLRNTTPGIIGMTGGDNQVVTTAGGATNDWRGTVTGVRPGNFTIVYSINGPACPCAANTSRWANYVGQAAPGGPASPLNADSFPLGFTNFQIQPTAVLGIRPTWPLWNSVTPLSDPFDPFSIQQSMHQAARRSGWHALDPQVAGVVDRVLSVSLEAAATGGAIPAAELKALQDLAGVDGFWNWLASSQSGGDLPVTLRYSTQDIQFLEAVVQSGGDVAKLRQALGPIKVAALSSMVAQQAASAERAEAFATSVNATISADGAVGAVDYETLMRTLWGDNEVYSALKYYGLVSGNDPGLGSFGWLLADYAYGWLTSPVETASRTRASLEAQSEYDEFLKLAGGDLKTLGQAVNGALAALDRLNTTFTSARLGDPASALGGTAARDLQGVLDKMQAAFDQATPAWKAAHASEVSAIRAHIDQKLADLAAAIGLLKEIADTLPKMIEWLRSVARDAQGGVKSGSQLYNPEIFVRLGAIAVYLETMAAAGLLVADDPSGASDVRGPLTPERRPMTLEELRKSGGR